MCYQLAIGKRQLAKKEIKILAYCPLPIVYFFKGQSAKIKECVADFLTNQYK
jgi:hypothetical protein